MSYSQGNIVLTTKNVDTPPSVVGANNGLTLDVSNKEIQLGGSLIKNTTIQAGSYALNLFNSSAGRFEFFPGLQQLDCNDRGMSATNTQVQFGDTTYGLGVLGITVGMFGDKHGSNGSVAGFDATGSFKLYVNDILLNRDRFSIDYNTGLINWRTDTNFNIQKFSDGSLMLAADFANNIFDAGDLSSVSSGLNMRIRNDGGSVYNFLVRSNVVTRHISINKDLAYFSVGEVGSSKYSAITLDGEGSTPTVSFTLGSVVRFFVSSAGIRTTNSSPPWKLFDVVSSPVAFDTTRYVSINIGGVPYKLALVN